MAAWLASCVAAAHAAVGFQAQGAQGIPGAQVAPLLRFSVDAPFPIFSVNLNIDYDGALLELDTIASTVKVDGNVVSFATLAASDIEWLEVESGVRPWGEHFFSASYLGLGMPEVRTGIDVAPVFRLAASALPGTTTTVSFSGSVFDVANDTDIEFTPPFLVTVSAVPEPAEWLLLLGGLLAVGAAARRRCT